MKTLSIMLFLSLLAISNTVFAATIGAYTEGVRDQVAGTTLVVPTDSPNSLPGFALGDLTSAGDHIFLHGRIVGAVDNYSFSSATAFTIEFIFGGLQLEGGGSTLTSGFVYDEQGNDNDNTADFMLDDGINPPLMAQYMTEVTGGNSLIFSVGPGTYDFIIDGTGGGALYDIKITAVPIPAALPLLLGGVGVLGLFGRKRKVTAA